MVIVLIRRFIRPDKEKEFLTAYHTRQPIEVPAFKGETLTRVSSAPETPAGLRGLALSGLACVTFLNISRWESWEAFAHQFDVTGTGFDPDIETTARQRVVLEVMFETSSAPEAFSATARAVGVRIEPENLEVMREGYLGLQGMFARLPQAPDFFDEPAVVFVPTRGANL